MEWLGLALPVLAALAVLYLPGGAVAVALGVRDLRILAAAPAISLGLVSLAAVGAQLLGVRFGILPVLGLAVLAVIAALLVSRRVAREPREVTPPGGWIWPACAIALAAVLWAPHAVTMLGTPGAISQTFDNIFHLNAVAYILQSGDGSSLTINGLGVEMGPTALYPAAWHDTVALVAMITGAGVPLSVNGLTVAAVAVVWPASCVSLVRVLIGSAPVTLLGTGILSASFSAFPLLLLDFGVLYPNFLAYAVLPGVLAVAVSAVGLGTRPLPPLSGWLLVLLSAPGLLLTHGNALHSALLVVVPAVLVRSIRALRTAASARGVLGAIAPSFLVLAVATLSWLFLRPGPVTWLPPNRASTSLGEALLANPMGRPAAWVVALLIAAGLVAMTRRSTWWLAPASVVTAFWMVASAGPDGDVRTFLTGVWYDDPFRLAALTPLAFLPIAALGIDALGARISGRLGRGAPRIAAAGAGLAVLAVLAPYSNAMRWEVGAVRFIFSSEDGGLLSTSERELLEDLPALVGPDAVLMTKPWDGSSLAWAIAGIPVTYPVGVSELPGDVEYLNQNLSAGGGPGLCAAIDSTGVTHVLDFGPLEVHPDFPHPLPGFEGLASSPNVELLAENDGARVYEIVACRN